MKGYEQYLSGSAVTKEVIDIFLDPAQPHLFQFDPELGYILGNDLVRDGMDGSLTITTTQTNGARRSIVYAGHPCRINTYGDSFTHCHQVSDHETWQEILAAHFGEPIRNFGVGGYGVYQAYRRMIRTEMTAYSAEYIILYIWGDDHMRSLLRCRHALTYPWWDSAGGRLFHGNFWTHLEMDLDTGSLVEKPSLLPTPESLYQMTDPDFMVETLHDDLMLQISAFCDGQINELDRSRLDRLSEIIGQIPVPSGDPDQVMNHVRKLRNSYAFAATKYILKKSAEFAEDHGKNLLIVLFDPNVTRGLIETGRRSDQEIVETLKEWAIRTFDMNLVHVNDYQRYHLPLDDYFKRYFIGHYNPPGNHFFAFSIKDELVDWLDPKPPTYREDTQRQVNFQGYLPAKGR